MDMNLKAFINKWQKAWYNGASHALLAQALNMHPAQLEAMRKQANVSLEGKNLVLPELDGQHGS